MMAGGIIGGGNEKFDSSKSNVLGMIAAGSGGGSTGGRGN